MYAQAIKQLVSSLEASKTNSPVGQAFWKRDGNIVTVKVEWSENSRSDVEHIYDLEEDTGILHITEVENGQNLDDAPYQQHNIAPYTLDDLVRVAGSLR